MGWQKRSNRAILEISDDTPVGERTNIYRQKGREIFLTLEKYYGDPATSAFDRIGKHFSDVAKDQFRNQTLQKGRMNSDWRYQYIAKDCAVASKSLLPLSGCAYAPSVSAARTATTSPWSPVYVKLPHLPLVRGLPNVSEPNQRA